MRQKTIKVFQLNELKPEAREKAIEAERQRQSEWMDLDWLEDDFEHLAIEQGFENTEWNWSFSNCQGDGASFTGTVNLHKHFQDCKQHAEPFLNKDPLIQIKRIDHNYSHANTCTLDWTSHEELTDQEEELMNQLCTEYDEKRIELCKKCEKIGYDQIDHMLSEEGITDIITDNEHEFTEDGTLW